jgi:glutathione synthase/RimK-type ligase-like ATP-grasp enzyme
MDTEDFPFEANLSTWVGPDRWEMTYTPPGAPAIDLSDVTSVWYRRVRVPEPREGMDPGIYDFCVREARAALVGALTSTRKPCMSPPAKIWAAEHKVLQLQVAREVGLVIPRTIITNDPSEILAAFTEFDQQMIVKPSRTGYVESSSGEYAIFTSQVLEEHLHDVEDARLSPAIYQPLVPKACDVRVTIVGQRIFTAEILSQDEPEAVVDWRKTTDPDLPHREGDLPSHVADALLKLMDSLGLEFGAVDFVRTPTNEYIFLEINPNGQWLWLDDKLGLGITDAVAAWHLTRATM